MSTNPESFALTFKKVNLYVLKLYYIIFAFILSFELIPIILSKLNEIIVSFKIRGSCFCKIKIHLLFEVAELVNEILADNFLQNAQYLSTSLKIREIFSLKLKYLNTNLNNSTYIIRESVSLINIKESTYT